MTKTTIQAQGFWRCYTINGTEINNIIFYNEDGIITETNQGWIENNRNDITKIEVENLANRNKINLTKKENFVVKTSETDLNGRKKAHLYLYVDGENITIEQTQKRHNIIETDYSLSYQHSDYVTYSGKIGDVNFNFEVLKKCENIDHEEKENAVKLFEELKNNHDIYGMDLYNFLRLYNVCSIKIRDKHLVK